MPVPEVSLGLNRQGKHWVDEGIIQGFITGAILAAITNPGTVAKLRNIGATLPEVNQRWYEEYQKGIDRAQACGALTDAGVESVRAAGAGTAIAVLRALFTVNDPTLAAVESFSTVA